MDPLEWELLIEAEPGDADTRVLLIEAELGDMFAQWELAAAYQIGKRIKQNLRKAFEWYLKSAEQGFAIAQRSLGLMYFEGIGTEQDYNKAAEFFIEAGEQGDVAAQYYLGILFMTKGFDGRNFNNSYEWLLEAYQNGHSDAHDALLVLYHADGILWDCCDDESKNACIGEIKVKDSLIFTCQDNTYSLTANEFEKILFEADFGNADAQYMLGVVVFCGYLLDGYIIKRNYSKASEWFQKASSKDYAYTYSCALFLCEGVDWHFQANTQGAKAEPPFAEEYSDTIFDFNGKDQGISDFSYHEAEESDNSIADYKIRNMIEALKEATFDDIVNEIRKKSQTLWQDKMSSFQML